MYQQTKQFRFILDVFLCFLISDVFADSTTDRDRDVINKSDITTCFRANDALGINVLPEQIKSVDGKRFYSFLVKIGWTSAAGKVSFHCGGTLISDKYVLSAAHCMDYERPLFKSQPDIVRVGEHLFEGIIVGEDIQIASIYVHPLYGVLTMYDDIALIELSKASKYQPACMWTGLILPTRDVFALGHDLQKIGTQQAMSLKFVNSSECDRRYSPSRKLPDGIIDSQVCAGNSNITEAEKCKGYIGGPLLTQVKANSDEVFVVGLTNYGQRCASSNYPNIYTKLSFYKDWINETVND